MAGEEGVRGMMTVRPRNKCASSDMRGAAATDKGGGGAGVCERRQGDCHESMHRGEAVRPLLVVETARGRVPKKAEGRGGRKYVHGV